jgi:hypothetical protein
MKRHRTHQIDELAQRFFRAAIPPTWSYNEQKNDYGKDYLVEPGDEEGEQTGLNFFVQLKGQEAVEYTADKEFVKFSLETMHAAYYVDKIRDLPVFLVVVDVNAQRGWFHFLQPGLEADQGWRKQDTVTVYLPVSNDLAEIARFRQAVESAKRTMRLLHPESIQDAIAAQKERVRAIDPRFNVRVSVLAETPIFELCPTEPVSGQIEFKGSKEKIEQKLTDLLDKGALVQFDPGEARITGSKLFESFERVGGAMQAACDVPGTINLVCLDDQGHELARLSEIPGRFTGGKKEAWFEGGLENSPLRVKLGPLGQEVASGGCNFNITLARWEGQRLLHLAYFDRIYQFFKGLAQSAIGQAEGHVHGNSLFTANLPWNRPGFAVAFSRYLEFLHKARKVVQHVNVNPVWTFKAFDKDGQENVEQLYGIFFEGGWKEAMPKVELTAKCDRKTFRFDVAAQAEQPGFVRLVSHVIYPLLGGEDRRRDSRSGVHGDVCQAPRRAENASQGEGKGKKRREEEPPSGGRQGTGQRRLSWDRIDRHECAEGGRG